MQVKNFKGLESDMSSSISTHCEIQIARLSTRKYIVNMETFMG